MNTSKLVDLISQNKQYESHRRKIQSIMTRGTQSLSFRKHNASSSFHSSKDKSNRFTLKMKQQLVDKQNDLILKKIIQVNRRSQTRIHPQNITKKDISHNNLSNLRKKLQKTNQQNQKLANKLVLTTSKLGQHLLYDSNRRQTEIKQRLRKYTYDVQTGMILPKKIRSMIRLSRFDPLLKESIVNRLENDP